MIMREPFGARPVPTGCQSFLFTYGRGLMKSNKVATLAVPETEGEGEGVIERVDSVSAPAPLASQFVPRYGFFTKGKGVHREKLTSFEMALRDAGIAQFNLVKVSSIFPGNCKIISKEKGLKYLQPGQIVYCVMSQSETNEPNRLIAAGIGLARPRKKGGYGYLSEHHSFGETSKRAGDY